MKPTNALLLLGFISVASGALRALAESEPNNNLPTANALSFDENGKAFVSGRINPRTEFDVFRMVTPPSPGPFSLTITLTPTALDRELDPWIELLDANGSRLTGRADSGGDNAPETISFPLGFGNTTYFVVCGSADWSISGTGDYELQVALDPNDQIAEATVLGTVAQTLSTEGQIDSPTDVDLFALTVQAGQRLSFDIDNTAGLDSFIRVFDSSGSQLSANDNAHGPGTEEVNNLNSYLEYTFGIGGTYYLGVSGAGNADYNPITGAGDSPGSTGSYALVVSPGIAGTARVNGVSTDYPVDIVRIDQKRIDPNQRTWIVIHGRSSSRSEPNIYAVTEAISLTRPDDQVLTLDWSKAASYTGFTTFGGEDAIQNVGAWAAAALRFRGFSGKSLNLVGHSWGSYVADELAERIPGGVGSITALDAAENFPGGYSPESVGEIDFSRDSEFSWAFHSDWIAGSNVTPPTADEAFIVTNSDHGKVVYLFADLLLNPNSPIGRLFSLANLLLGSFGPWVADQYISQLGGEYPVGGYEAVVVANPGGTSAQSILFVTNAPSLTISSHANGATVTSSLIILSGTATDAGRGGSGILSVLVNGCLAVNDSATGVATANWGRSVELSPGANVVEVVAFDGSSTRAATTNWITVNYTPPTEANLAMSVSEDAVTLVWPAGLAGYTLQQSDQFVSPGDWIGVSGVPTVIGSSNVIVLTVSQAMQFFRLAKP